MSTCETGCLESIYSHIARVKWELAVYTERCVFFSMHMQACVGGNIVPFITCHNVLTVL